MKALIDGDLIVFINAASAENDESYFAMTRCSNHIERILKSVNTTEFIVFISGGHNFRYDLNPSYKANRTGPEPRHRQICKQFLINEWDAVLTEGYEADDALGCNQTEDSIICSLDKDLMMIPGQHYSWPLSRKGKIIKEESFSHTEYLEGMKSFFRQMLTGDVSDNIRGLSKIGPVTAANYIDHLTTEEEMYEVVKQLYEEHGRDDFDVNLDLLWIWRNLGETYTIRRDFSEKV